jgi:hypothetical protein
MGMASKVLYLCPVGIDDFGLFPLKYWNGFGDVEDICVDKDAGCDFLRGV